MIPREHGAWAMLLLPYLSGIAAADWSEGAVVKVALGAGGILALFMARSPAMKLAKNRYRQKDFGKKAGDYRFSASVYSVIGALLFGAIMVLGGYRQLLLLGALVFAASLIQTWLAMSLGDRSIAAEAIGIMLLALAAPLGSVLASGGGLWEREVLTLWAANASFYGSSIFTVKMKVYSTVGRRGGGLTAAAKLARARASFSYIAAVSLTWLLAAITGATPALVPIAFLPMAAHAAWSAARLGAPLNIRREGFTQLGLSVAFTLTIVAVWRSGW